MAQITKEAFEAARAEFQAAKQRAAQIKFPMYVLYKATGYWRFSDWGQSDEWALKEIGRVFTLEEAAPLIEMRVDKPTLYVAKQMEVAADDETTDVPLWASDAMVGTTRLENGVFLDPWQDDQWRAFNDIVAGPRIHIMTNLYKPDNWKDTEELSDLRGVYHVTWWQ